MKYLVSNKKYMQNILININTILFKKIVKFILPSINLNYNYNIYNFVNI